MKRGRITNNQLRITKPGFDVDTSPDYGFNLHEQFLYSQPFWWKFIPNPFASVPPGTVQDQSVTETFPNTGALPIVALYPVASTGAVLFPYPASYGVVSGSQQFLESWTVTYTHTNTSITVRFIRPAPSQYTMLGVQVMLMRSPVA